MRMSVVLATGGSYITLHPPFLRQKIAHFATNHTAGEGEVLSNLTQPTHDEIMMHMPF